MKWLWLILSCALVVSLGSCIGASYIMAQAIKEGREARERQTYCAALKVQGKMTKYKHEGCKR